MTNRYELHFDQARLLGRIEVFNEKDVCLASRTVHSTGEAAQVVKDFDPLLNLTINESLAIVDSFRAQGLP